jgi:hypothetical protein
MTIFLLRMRNVSAKITEEIKTHILCSIPYSENRAVCEITWKNTVEPGRPQMTIEKGASTLHAG